MAITKENPVNTNLEIFASVVSFRKGASAQGVRADLREDSIPEEIRVLLAMKKPKKAN